MKLFSQKLFFTLVTVCFTSTLLNLHAVQAENTIPLTALGTPYYQDFNSLSNSSESGTLPVGWVLVETKTNANNMYKASTGNANVGDTYSFGSTNASDRALGGIQDGTLVPLFGASFTNHTGGVIQSITIKYTGEEWRLSRLTRSDKLVFEFSTDATSLLDGVWSKSADLDFFTPYVATVGSRDGNATANRTVLQTTIPALSIEPGKTFWIRWTDFDAFLEDDGLAVDDFSLIAYGLDNGPTLTSISPADKTVDAALDSVLSISFSEPVNLADGWISLSCSISKEHTLSVDGGPQAFVVDPNLDFVNGDICTVTVVAARVTDQDSTDPPDTLVKDYSFTFSTLPLPDAAPIITSTSPSNNETAVLLDSGLSVHFSEPVAVSPGWFTLECTKSGFHSAAIDDSASTFILTPQKPFQYDESCTLTINASAIADLDSNDPPESMLSDFIITFSTLSTPDTAPYILSSIPANNAISIPINQTIELTFNEPVSVEAGTFKISCKSGEVFTLNVSGGPTIFQVKPDHNFNFADNCSVSVTAQSVTDQDSYDPPDKMLMDQTINFETAANPDTAPEISQTTPTNGAVDVAVNSNISISFSEDISGTGDWAELGCSVSGEHSFVISGTSRTPTIDPDIGFANNESCTLAIFGSQIHDLDEKDPPDVMAQDYSLTFSTASPTDQAPTVVDTYPSNLAVDIPVDRQFSITFSEPVYPMLGWINFSCAESGAITVFVEGGPTNFTIGSDMDLKFFEKCTVTINADKVYDMDKDDPPDFMGSNYTYSFTAMKSPTPTIENDETITPHDKQYLHESLNHLSVQFSKDVLHDGSSKAADNSENYLLLKPGLSNLLTTNGCEKVNFDESIAIGEIVYDASTFTADLPVNGGVDLPNGTYRLIICGTHPITDLDGNPVNYGLDTIITFTINTADALPEPTDVDNPPGSDTGSGAGTNSVSSNNSVSTTHPLSSVPIIPVTGFRRGEVTLLPPQLTAYTDLGDTWLEVPALDLETAITGVPKKNGSWDVTWLGNQAGWLGGSALPGQAGNSVLTAHVWDALNQPGPFYGLEKLQYGDQVIVHAWGDVYVYEVREVLNVKPENVKAMMKHQEKAWLTLVTCQGYDEDSGEYQHRVLIRAVLMEVR